MKIIMAWVLSFLHWPIVWRWPNGGIISAKTRQQNWPLIDGDTAGHDWINYPMERVNINDVYPDFDEWLGGTGNANWDEPIEGTYINAIGYLKNGSIAGKPLYDIARWMPPQMTVIFLRVVL